MILLTGATGKVGSETAKALAARGMKARALVRNADKAAALKALDIDLVIGDAGDAASVSKALAGAERLLVLLPNSQRQLELETSLVDQAKRAGVRHIVKISSMEAVADATAAIPKIHWASEEHIRKSGMAWTMIKPNFFMQNFLASARSIKESKSFSMPMGNGKTAMSDARDIGAVTAEALAGKGHEGKSYEITGPELLTFAEAAERFSSVLGTQNYLRGRGPGRLPRDPQEGAAERVACERRRRTLPRGRRGRLEAHDRYLQEAHGPRADLAHAVRPRPHRGIQVGGSFRSSFASAGQALSSSFGWPAALG